MLAIFLVGCTNLRHATNINLGQIKGLKFQKEQQKTLNNKIKIITEQDAKKCKLLQNDMAKDTVLEQGKHIPVLYLKAKAYELDANAIIIDSEEKVGDYGHVVKGRIFICPE